MRGRDQPGDRRQVARLTAEGVAGNRNTHIAFGAGRLWILQGGVLRRVEPLAARVETERDPGVGDDLTAGEGAVWLTDKVGRVVVRVDPESIEPVDQVTIPSTPDRVAVGAGKVWLLSTGAGTVTPIDAASTSAEEPIRVGSDPADITVGLGYVWVANRGDGTVSRIDPVTRQVATFPIGGPPTALAVDPENELVWVLVGPTASAEEA